MDNVRNRAKLVSIAKKIYSGEPSGHDFSHIKRVLKYAKAIHKKEGGDWEVIFISVLFHDVHRVMQSQTGEYVDPEDAMPEVERIFSENKKLLPKKKIEKILLNISKHEERDAAVDNIEFKILQDADILDGHGKTGLRRTKKYCVFHGIPFFLPRPLDDPEYVVDINPISTSHFISRTLLLEYDDFKTETAKKLAQKDRKVLLNFIEREKKKYYKRQNKTASE